MGYLLHVSVCFVVLTPCSEQYYFAMFIAFSCQRANDIWAGGAQPGRLRNNSLFKVMPNTKAPFQQKGSNHRTILVTEQFIRQA